MRTLIPQGYQIDDPYHTATEKGKLIPEFKSHVLGRGGLDIFEGRTRTRPTPGQLKKATKTMDFLMSNKKRLMGLGQAINLRLQMLRNDYEFVRRGTDFQYAQDIQDEIERTERDFHDWQRMKKFMQEVGGKISKAKKTSTAVNLTGVGDLGILPLLILGASAIGGASWVGGKAVEQFSEYKQEEQVMKKLERGELTQKQAENVLKSIQVPESEKVTLTSEIAKGAGSAVKWTALGLGALAVGFVGYNMLMKKK